MRFLSYLTILGSFLLSGNGYSQWTEMGDIIFGIGESYSGYAVDMNSSGNRIAIGGPSFIIPGLWADGDGSVAIYDYIDNEWILNDEIFGLTIEYSGYSVALNGDGTVFATGGPRNSVTGSWSGCVRVYREEEDGWVPVGSTLYGTDEEDRFGTSVSLNEDATILAVSTPNYGDGLDENGLLRMYELVEDDWVQIGDDILGPDGTSHFGRDVMLSDDGNRVVVCGDLFVDDASLGVMKIYERDGEAWNQIGEDIIGAIDTLIGYSVAISGDGNVVACGNNLNPGAVTDTTNAGHVSAYRWNEGEWEQYGSNLFGEYTNDYFGVELDLNVDGTVLAVAAGPNPGDEYYGYSGNSKIFEFEDDWELIGESLSEFAIQLFGKSISMNSEGNAFVTGAHWNGGGWLYAGAANVFYWCDPIEFDIVVDDSLICLGEAVNLEAIGPYDFEWSNAIENGIDFYPETIGLNYYTVTAHDTIVCFDSTEIAVNVFDELTLEYTTTDEIFGADGSIDITVEGGLEEYHFDWDIDEIDDFDDSEDLTGLTAGMYIVQVRDSAECLVKDTILVQSQLSITAFSSDNFEVFPNPTSDRLYVNLLQFSGEKYSLFMYDNAGKEVFRNSELTQSLNEIDINFLKPGVYYIVIQTNESAIKSEQIQFVIE